MRRILLIFASLFLLLAAALFALPFLIDVNQYHDLITRQLEQRLHRTISLGNMSLKVIPLSIRIENVSIGEAPSFSSSKPFASAKLVSVSVGLFALLRKQIDVNTLRLVQPSVVLIRNPQGDWNYETLGKSSAPSESSGSTAVEFDQLAIEDGTVEWIDRKSPASTSTYDHIDFDLRNFAPGKQFELRLAAHLPGQGAQELSFSGKGGPIPAGAAAQMPFDGKLTVKEVALSGLTRFLQAKGYEDSEAILTGETQVRSGSQGIAAKGNLTVKNARIRKSTLALPLNFDFDLQHDPSGRLKLSRFEAKAGGMTVAAAGEVETKPAPPLLHLKVHTPSGSLADIFPIAGLFGASLGPDLKMEGQLKADLNVEGPASKPQVSGAIEATSLQMQDKDWKQPVRVSQIHIDLSPDAIRSQPFTAESGATRLNGAFAINQYASSSPTVHAEFKTVGGTVPELLNLTRAFGLSATEGITGSGNLNIDLKADGPLKDPNLSGTGALDQTTLNLPTFKKPIQIRTANLRFEETKAVADLTGLTLGSSNLKGNLSIKNFSAPELQFALEGDQWNVGELQQLLNTPPPAKPEAPASGKPAPNPVEKISGGGTLSVATLRMDNLTLKNVKTTCRFDHGVVRLDPVNAELFGGLHTGAITVDTRGGQTAFAVNSKLDKVDANQLLSSTTSIKQLLYGLIAANTDARFVSRPGQDLAPTLNGTINLNLTQGKLAGVNLLNAMAVVVKSLGYAQSSQTFTNIVKMSGLLKITNGVASTDDLRLDLDGASAGVTGTVNLTDQSLNLKLTTVFSQALSQQIGGNQVGGFMTTALANDKGELVIPTLVSGSFAKPRFLPDGARIAEMKMQNLVPSLKNPASLTTGILGELQQGKKPSVGGVLDMLKGKPQPTATPAPGEPQQPAAAPEQKKASPAGGIFDIINSVRKQTEKKPEQKQQ